MKNKLFLSLLYVSLLSTSCFKASASQREHFTYHASAPPKPLFVLAIDGGYENGLVAAQILKTIKEKAFKGNEDLSIGQHFDLIVGNSSGAVSR